MRINSTLTEAISSLANYLNFSIDDEANFVIKTKTLAWKTLIQAINITAEKRHETRQIQYNETSPDLHLRGYFHLWQKRADSLPSRLITNPITHPHSVPLLQRNCNWHNKSTHIAKYEMANTSAQNFTKLWLHAWSLWSQLSNLFEWYSWSVHGNRFTIYALQFVYSKAIKSTLNNQIKQALQSLFGCRLWMFLYFNPELLDLRLSWNILVASSKYLNPGWSPLARDSSAHITCFYS